MFKRLARSAALGTVAAAAAAAAIGIGAFALYAALEPGLGRAGAAAIVAALFLLVAIIAVLLLRGGGDEAKADAGAATAPSSNPLAQVAALRERATTLVAQRPLVAGAVGLAAGVYLLRNPALLAALIGVVAGRAEGKLEERRRYF